jgi:hypothetical protein
LSKSPTGADQPYDKLKRALRTEIDEAAWSTLDTTTTSRPSNRPQTGKLAVKVINHYGDEVLKVFRVISSLTPPPVYRTRAKQQIIAATGTDGPMR